MTRDSSSNDYSLDAGALVLADQGVCICISNHMYVKILMGLYLHIYLMVVFRSDTYVRYCYQC